MIHRIIVFFFKDVRNRSAIIVYEVKFGTKILPAYSPLEIKVKVTGDSFIINKLEYYNFRLLFESEIALFLNEVWRRSAIDEELARNHHYPPHLRW